MADAHAHRVPTKVELAEHDNAVRPLDRHLHVLRHRPPVVNDVRATLRFADGLMSTTSTSQLLEMVASGPGPEGRGLGWTPFLRRKVGGTAKAGLDKFIAKESKRAAS